MGLLSPSPGETKTQKKHLRCKALQFILLAECSLLRALLFMK